MVAIARAGMVDEGLRSALLGASFFVPLRDAASIGSCGASSVSGAHSIGFHPGGCGSFIKTHRSASSRWVVVFRGSRRFFWSMRSN